MTLPYHRDSSSCIYCDTWEKSLPQNGLLDSDIHAAEVDEVGGYDQRACDTAQFDMTEFTRRMETVTLDVVGE